MVYKINSTSAEGDNFTKRSRVKFALGTNAINPLQYHHQAVGLYVNIIAAMCGIILIFPHL